MLLFEGWKSSLDVLMKAPCKMCPSFPLFFFSFTCLVARLSYCRFTVCLFACSFVVACSADAPLLLYTTLPRAGYHLVSLLLFCFGLAFVLRHVSFGGGLVIFSFSTNSVGSVFATGFPCDAHLHTFFFFKRVELFCSPRSWLQLFTVVSTTRERMWALWGSAGVERVPDLPNTTPPLTRLARP